MKEETTATYVAIQSALKENLGTEPGFRLSNIANRIQSEGVRQRLSVGGIVVAEVVKQRVSKDNEE